MQLRWPRVTFLAVASFAHSPSQEKWRTIRFRLCGVPSPGVQAPGWLVEEMKTTFGCLQPAFERVVRMDPSCSRYSFPNYNFCFRRIFDLYGCSHFNGDFPPLKSKTKREEIVFLWLKIINYLRWPYINSDAQIFGRDHRTNARTIWKQRTERAARSQPKPRSTPARAVGNVTCIARHGGYRQAVAVEAAEPRAATYADPSDHRFRWLYAPRARPPSPELLSDEWFADLCRPYPDASDDPGDEPGDGHSHQRHQLDMDGAIGFECGWRLS